MFGDEGKGTVVDALVRKHNASVVVRYNGGAQAAHNVVTDDGKHHTFSQFGSGTFVPGVKTFLSQFMLVNPLAMQIEAKKLEALGVHDPLRRVYVDRRCLITTPYHRALNRLREMARGKNRHGSCGMGIGETMTDFLERGEEVIRAQDIIDLDHTLFRKKLYATHAAMREKIRDLEITEAIETPETSEAVKKELSTFDVHTDAIIKRYHEWTWHVSLYDAEAAKLMLGGAEAVVFEGAQGVLLDETHGFHPYTTWSTTTTRNAYAVLDELGLCQDTHEIGIVRPYMTRHGAGPFVTEYAGLRTLVDDDHNVNNEWQKDFRVGTFDGVMLDYALRVNGPVDSIAITHTDKLARHAWWEVADSYDFDPIPEPELPQQENLTHRLFHTIPHVKQIAAYQMIDWIAARAKAPVSVGSLGPKPSDKIFK